MRKWELIEFGSGKAEKNEGGKLGRWEGESGRWKLDPSSSRKNGTRPRQGCGSGKRCQVSVSRHNSSNDMQHSSFDKGSYGWLLVVILDAAVFFIEKTSDMIILNDV